MSMSATRSSRPPRDALTSTTSGPATFSRNHSPARSTVSTWRVVPSSPRAATRASRMPSAPAPTTTTWSIPSSSGQRPDRAVLLLRASAELEHRAQHRDRAPTRALAHPGERLQGSPHRVGVGVVGVVHDDEPVGPLVQLHPPLRQVVDPAQALGDLGESQPRRECGGGGGRGVGGLVLAQQLQGDLLGVAAGGQVEGRAPQVVERHVAETYVGRRRAPEEHVLARWCASAMARDQRRRRR